MKSLGLSWGRSPEHSNTKNPAPSAPAQLIISVFSPDRRQVGLGMCRIGILTWKPPVSTLMSAYLWLCTLGGKGIAPISACLGICLANEDRAYSLLICWEMESEKLKLISPTNIVTEHHRAVSWLWFICMLLHVGAGAIEKHQAGGPQWMPAC